MAHTFSHILVHLVCSTNDRRPFIDTELKPRLLSYMGGILKEIGAKELAAHAVSDHVHLLVSLPSTLYVADMMRIVKTDSSKWVHETWPEREFGWQTGYGAFSVSKSNADAVRAYIANQEQHHRTVSFQDEFVEFLDKHRIEYDPRYLWE